MLKMEKEQILKKLLIVLEAGYKAHEEGESLEEAKKRFSEIYMV